MSIFTKVTVLFLVSLGLMLFIGSEIETINTQKQEIVLKDKYLQASKALFNDLSVADMTALRSQLPPLKLKQADMTLLEQQPFTTLYEQVSLVSTFKILKDTQQNYFLFLQYLDDSVLLADYSHDEEGIKGHYLSLLVLSDIIILVLIFLIILKMLSPLKRFANTMERFSLGDYAARLNEAGNDEIGTLSKTYNAMAERLERLISSRQRLLRDVGHELRTPVAKGKFAAEMLDDSAHKAVVKKAFDNLDELISELLHIEQLNAGAGTLNTETFDAESLIVESLSRLFIDDESSVRVEISDNFAIKGDRYYLAVALKNLIDNALKYADELPIIITAKAQGISVASRGEALSEPLEYYLGEFTRAAEHQGEKGYGLGLNIVKSVLDKHGFELEYSYEEGYNRFSLSLQ